MAFSRITAAFLGLCLAGVNAASAETRRFDIVGTGDGIDVLRAIAASFMQQEGSGSRKDRHRSRSRRASVLAEASRPWGPARRS